MKRPIRNLFSSSVAKPVTSTRRTRLSFTSLEDRVTPATLRVNSWFDNIVPGDGTVTLREAIIAANNDTTTDLGETGSGADTIVFVGAPVGTTVPILLTSGNSDAGLPPITSNITIQGPTTARTIITDGASSADFRLFYVSSTGDLTISDLTITNPAPTNSGSNSGGIWNTGGQLTVRNSLFTGNRTGGIGAAILISGGFTTIEDSTFENNRTNGDNGGAINVQDGGLSVSGSTFSNNNGLNGGAMLISGGGNIEIWNSTFSANNASNVGGAIHSLYTRVGINSCTFALNTASGTGAGIYHINDGGDPFNNVLLNNSLFSVNLSNGGSDNIRSTPSISSSGSNNLLDSSANTGGMSTNPDRYNLIGVNPLLLPLANNGGKTFTHALGQNSPALAAGFSSSSYDQRGTARDSGATDIGAYEVQHPLSTVGAPTTLAKLYAPKPSASANEAFVKGLYQSTVLREADAVGLAGWLTVLANGTSRDTVANGFVNSVENRQNQVKFFYKYFLGREAETAGLNYWVDILRSGTDEGTVMTGFILSTEFSGNNNNAQFVNLMYYALLSRQAETAGFNGWLNALNNGTPRSTVVQSFLRSTEGINRVMGSMFQTYLKRAASSGDLAAYQTFLNTNTFGNAARSLLGSTEFFNNAASNMS